MISSLSSPRIISAGHGGDGLLMTLLLLGEYGEPGLGLSGRLSMLRLIPICEIEILGETGRGEAGVVVSAEGAAPFCALEQENDTFLLQIFPLLGWSTKNVVRGAAVSILIILVLRLSYHYWKRVSTFVLHLTCQSHKSR